jgi:hypothetical protein
MQAKFETCMPNVIHDIIPHKTPLPYVSYSLSQVPVLPCASSKCSLAYINSDSSDSIFFFSVSLKEEGWDPRQYTGDTHANLNQIIEILSWLIRKSAGDRPDKMAMFTTLNS